MKKVFAILAILTLLVLSKSLYADNIPGDPGDDGQAAINVNVISALEIYPDENQTTITPPLIAGTHVNFSSNHDQVFYVTGEPGYGFDITVYPDWNQDVITGLKVIGFPTGTGGTGSTLGSISSSVGGGNIYITGQHLGITSIDMGYSSPIYYHLILSTTEIDATQADPKFYNLHHVIEVCYSI